MEECFFQRILPQNLLLKAKQLKRREGWRSSLEKNSLESRKVGKNCSEEEAPKWRKWIECKFKVEEAWIQPIISEEVSKLIRHRGQKEFSEIKMNLKGLIYTLCKVYKKFEFEEEDELRKTKRESQEGVSGRRVWGRGYIKWWH